MKHFMKVLWNISNKQILWNSRTLYIYITLLYNTVLAAYYTQHKKKKCKIDNW